MPGLGELLFLFVLPFGLFFVGLAIGHRSGRYVGRAEGRLEQRDAGRRDQRA